MPFDGTNFQRILEFRVKNADEATAGLRASWTKIDALLSKTDTIIKQFPLLTNSRESEPHTDPRTE